MKIIQTKKDTVTGYRWLMFFVSKKTENHNSVVYRAVYSIAWHPWWYVFLMPFKLIYWNWEVFIVLLIAIWIFIEINR